MIRVGAVSVATLAPMPQLVIPPGALVPFGQKWASLGGKLNDTKPHTVADLTAVFDNAVAQSLSAMLGGIPIVAPGRNQLIPPNADCVEVGPVRVIGAVRPQNFDVGYRPDGIRIVHDTKTLNDTSSVAKNWQNMINDLATESTTVHNRFPHALTTFLVILPEPCVSGRRLAAMTETLERLTRRVTVVDPEHMAEAVALVLWDPAAGAISPTLPTPGSSLRIETFHERVEAAYVSRYKGLPPHTL